MEETNASDTTEENHFQTIQALTVQLITVSCELAIMLGGVVPYVPQYVQIRKSQNTQGFSLYVCLALLMANTMRIVFWFGKHYETPLLIQSILMNICMFALVQLCVKVNTKENKSSHTETHSSLLNEQEVIVQERRRERVFTDFDPAFFWKWTDFSSYVEFTMTVAALASMLMYFLIEYKPFVEFIGFVAVFTEALLGVPQFYRNLRNKSTYGMSVPMVLMWTTGDVFKTSYFYLRNTPPQFFICGSLQEEELDMLDDNRKMRSTPGHDGVMETPLGSPLVEVKDVVVVVNRSDIKTNSSSGVGVGIPSFLPGGGGGNKNKGSVSSNIKAPDYPPIERGVSIIGKSLNFVEQSETDFKEVIEEQMRIHAESMSIFSNEDVRKSLGSDNGSFYLAGSNGGSLATVGVGSGIGGVEDLMSPQGSGCFRQGPIDLPKFDQLVPLKKPPISSSISEPLPTAAVVSGNSTSTVFVPPSMVAASVGVTATALPSVVSISSTSRPTSSASCTLHRASLVSQDSFVRGLGLAGSHLQGSLTSQDSVRGLVNLQGSSLASQESVARVGIAIPRPTPQQPPQGNLVRQSSIATLGFAGGQVAHLVSQDSLARSIVQGGLNNHDTMPRNIVQGTLIGNDAMALVATTVAPPISNIMNQDTVPLQPVTCTSGLVKQDSITLSICSSTHQQHDSLIRQDSINTHDNIAPDKL